MRRRKFHRTALKKQGKIIIISLFIILLFLSFGYATFNTNINLSAKGNINKTPDTCFTVLDNGDGTGTITDYDKTCGTKVKIPNQINNLTITRIGDALTTESKIFSRKGIKSLKFPDTLEYIGNASCIGLEGADIVIPNKVKIIGHHAFAWGAMRSIKLNEGLESIGGGAFEFNALTNLKIPSTVKNMYNTIASANFIEGDNAFIYMQNENGKVDNTVLISFGDRTRKEVIIPDNVKIISAASFVTNYGIEKITIPDSVTTIQGNAFWAMDNLKEVNIGSGVNDISSFAFNGVQNLTTININKKENTLSGAPWGATNATVNWTGTN